MSDTPRHDPNDPVPDRLARLRAADLAERAAEVEKVRLLLDLADLWQVDEPASLDAVARLEGREKKVVGADGTTPVGEFLALEVGPLLGVTPYRAALQIADAVNLRDRHPHLWESVQQGALRMWQANHLTRACLHLPHAASLWVDRQLALAADAGLPWPRMRRLVTGLVVKADPALAEQRARSAAERRGVWSREFDDGHAQIGGSLAAADAAAFHETIEQIADDLMDEHDDTGAFIFTHRDTARAAAIGVLARSYDRQEPTQSPSRRTGRPRRRATLIVHVADENLASGEGVARVEGWGPELISRLPRLLAGCHVTVRPVVNPDHELPVDAYEIPERLRFAVHQRHPYDVFPFSGTPASSCDTDHTRPYDPGGPPGQTCYSNLAPLSRRAHRGKTHSRFTVEPLGGDRHLWTSRYGYRYLTTPSGARYLDPKGVDTVNCVIQALAYRAGNTVDLWVPRA